MTEQRPLAPGGWAKITAPNGRIQILKWGSTYVLCRGRTWRISPGGKVYLVRDGKEQRLPRWMARLIDPKLKDDLGARR